MQNISSLGILVILGSVLSLSACGGGSSDSSSAGKSVSMKILHINDHHSHLEANTGQDLTLGGEKTRVEMGGFPRVVSKIKSLETESNNVLKLHAGDAITGDLYYTLFKGEADAALMNEVCFDAFALGNHEFDDGDAGLKGFLDDLYSPTCQTPVLAANVVPKVGVSPLTPTSATDYIRPYMIKEFDGEKVGIIGIDIATKTKNSSSPDDTTEFLDETVTAQKYIDELKANGVNKIILMTHYQYANDITLAGNLSGVDVIVGGDSHSLLGAKFEDFGLNSVGDYPTQKTDKEGNKVCIVQAWQYAAVVGELDVSFDKNGNVESCGGTPHLLLGNSFKRKDSTGTRVEISGADLTTVTNEIDQTPELSILDPDANASSVLSAYSSQVDVLKQSVIGVATENLCFERIPGQGRSTVCNVSETASRGSDISNIVAKAFREMSITSDIAIQNGGGVRQDIPAGNVTIGDAYLLLPFANTLVELDMTGAEIIKVLEEAASFAIDPNGSTGAYPYASGLRWNLDLSQPAGQRFSNVQVKLKTDTNWSAIDLNKSYKVVSNSFTAGGKDGYLTFGDVSNDGRVLDTYLDYAQSFVDYVTSVGTISKLPADEYSTQSFTNAQGVPQ